MENQLATLRLEHENQLQKTLSDLEKERDQVKNQLLLQEKENELSLASVKQNYEPNLKQPVNKSNFTRTLRLNNLQKLSVKVWNSMQRVSSIRYAVLPFQNAYFEKDNKVSARGSKGDFIFRECDENGVEIISYHV